MTNPKDPNDKPSFHIRDPEAEALLKSIGGTLKAAMPPGYAFTLVITNLEPGNVFYLSTVERVDSVRLLLDTLLAMLGEPPAQPPTGEPQ